ncbi:MAG: AAA family ATPase [Prevotella sp.]|nr:AAA family ATPase [Prevotella sp.]
MDNPRDLILASLNGEACTVTPEMLRLDGYRLTSETDVPEEEFLFRHFGKPCFPRKELTSIAGPAKSGKTFFTSMVMACCIRQQVMSLERVRKEPLRVMWYDTEQSRNTTKEILAKRIGRMIGHTKSTEIFGSPDGSKSEENLRENPTGREFPDEQFFVFNVRAASIKERRELLGVAVATYRPDLVVLDGISDLLNDINDGPRATELMEELLQLAETYNCNITAIIHLNRTGDKNNLRGWLGTVMLQKSFEVFNCSQVSQTETLSVEQSVSRKYRCLDTLYYEIDQEGIPFTTQKPGIQPRDTQGRWTKATPCPKDTLNHDYIIEHNDKTDTPWEWDLRRLFSDAMGNLPSLSDEQLKQAVMKLSRIRQYQYYYKVLDEAEKQGIVRKTLDRYRRVAIILVPPR